jgi:hypothetical protein
MNQQQRRQRRIAIARWLEQDEQDPYVKQGEPGAGVASNFIHYLKDLLLKFGTTIVRVVLYCRESFDNGNLQDQVDALRRAVQQLANKLDITIAIVGEVAEVCSGKIPNRRGFLQAVTMAEENAADALVALTTDRFLRNPVYTPQHSDAWPTTKNFEDLQAYARGVQLATVLRPDTPYRKIHANHIRRGQQAKDNKGGRHPAGYMKARRDQLKPIVWLFRG